MYTNEKMSAVELTVLEDTELQVIEGGVTTSEWNSIRDAYKLLAIANPILLPGYLIGDAIYT